MVHEEHYEKKKKKKGFTRRDENKNKEGKKEKAPKLDMTFYGQRVALHHTHK
jgi:hypothetical protein